MDFFLFFKQPSVIFLSPFLFHVFTPKVGTTFLVLQAEGIGPVRGFIGPCCQWWKNFAFQRICSSQDLSAALFYPFYIKKEEIFQNSKVADTDSETSVVYPVFIEISVDSTNGAWITDKQLPLRAVEWQGGCCDLLRASFQHIIYLHHVFLHQTALCRSTEVGVSGSTVGKTNKNSQAVLKVFTASRKICENSSRGSKQKIQRKWIPPFQL